MQVVKTMWSFESTAFNYSGYLEENDLRLLTIAVIQKRMDWVFYLQCSLLKVLDQTMLRFCCDVHCKTLKILKLFAMCRYPLRFCAMLLQGSCCGYGGRNHRPAVRIHPSAKFYAEHVLTVEKTKRKRGRKWSIFKNSESLLNEKLTRLSIKRINLAHLKRSSFDT